uniref:Adenosine deaminase n=1 Tax=Panagrellus redivivus TaxID=6233 RepID=A0A7E4VXE3_PANRE
MTKDFKKHAIKRWAEDDVNFSLNTDDPSLFDTDMNKELVFGEDKFEMDLNQLWLSQLNAAKSSFLPADLKEQLIVRIKIGHPSLAYLNIIGTHQ